MTTEERKNLMKKRAAEGMDEQSALAAEVTAGVEQTQRRRSGMTDGIKDAEELRNDKIGGFVLDKFDELDDIWEGMKEQGQFKEMANFYTCLLGQVLPKRTPVKGSAKKNTGVAEAFASKLDRLQKGR